MRFESILLRRSKARAIDVGSKGRNERWYVVSPRRIQRIVDVDSEDDLIGLLQVKEESRHEAGCDAAHKWAGECGEEGVGS